MNKLIKEKIYSGQFLEAKKIIAKLNEEQLFLLLKEIAYDQGLVAYSFICFLIGLENKAAYHAFAAHLLALPLCANKGAYNAGLFHAREAVRLDPNDVTNKELLLLFNRIPEHLLQEKEAIQIAKEIIKEKPNSTAAREILKTYNKADEY